MIVPVQLGAAASLSTLCLYHKHPSNSSRQSAKQPKQPVLSSIHSYVRRYSCSLLPSGSPDVVGFTQNLMRRLSARSCASSGVRFGPSYGIVALRWRRLASNAATSSLSGRGAAASPSSSSTTECCVVAAAEASPVQAEASPVEERRRFPAMTCSSSTAALRLALTTLAVARLASTAPGYRFKGAA